MRDQLIGVTVPVLSVSLDPGESVVAEAGEFAWMTDSIQMSAGTGDRTGASLSTYTAKGVPGDVAFAARLPGSILRVDVGHGREFLTHRHGFLAATTGVKLGAGFHQAFTEGLFARDGFQLQRIGGEGRAWVELAGEPVRHELAAGHSLRAHPGHVGLFESTVTFQMMRVPGMVNRYFGGDTHHFAVLSGPGTVWLQSVPLPVLAASLAPYLPSAATIPPENPSAAPPQALGDPPCHDHFSERAGG
jgi:uncharacterized protein (AIM24 family)